MIQDVYQFFLSYHRLQQNQSMKKVFDFCNGFEYLHVQVESQPSPVFLHNGSISLHNQLKPLMKENIEEIEIITLYFDQKTVATEWIEHFQPKQLNFIIQDKTSNFPLNREQHPNTNRYLLSFKEKEYTQKRYQGKVFCFKGSEEDVVIYGSANFSQQALLRSFAEQGNGEAVIVEKGPVAALTSFSITR